MRSSVVGLFGLLALVLSLGLIGCSDDGEVGFEPGDGPDGRGLSSDGGDPLPLAATTAANPAADAGRVAADPTTGEAGDLGSLRLAMVEPASHRPDEVVLSDQAGVVLADLLYLGLTEAQGTDGVLRPGLAQSWSAGAGFRRWTFELDPDRGIDAETVVRSLRPLTVGATNGADRVRRPMASLAAGLASVEAVDASTVVVELEQPNAGLPWVLSGLPYSIVGPDGAPTGDWQIADRDSAGLVLEPRPGRKRSRGYDRIEIRWTDERSQAHQLLVEGAADGAVIDPAAMAAPDTDAGSAAAAADGVGAGSVVGPGPTTAVRFYVVNGASAQLADPGERAELLARVDRAGLVVGSGRVDLLPIEGLVPPTMAGHRPISCPLDPCNPTGGSEPTGARSDVDRRSDLATARPLVISHVGADQAAMAQALAVDLTAIGAPARAVSVPADRLASAIVDGSTDLFAFGWLAPAGSVDAVLPPLLGPSSPANVARAASPELADLLATAAVTADDQARWDLLDRAHRLALAEGSFLPVAVSTGSLALAPGLPGVEIRADGSIDLESSP